MPIEKGSKQYSTFVKGIVTEASALTYPENASLDESNFVLNINGSRSRRLGIDFEDSYVKTDTGITTGTLNTQSILLTDLWTFTGSAGIKKILIVVFPGKIYFFDADASPTSASILNGGSALSIADINNKNCQIGSTSNTAIVAVNKRYIYRITYDDVADVFSYETVYINIRDLQGVDDALEVNERPVTLSVDHNYNLLNQGWSDTNIAAFFSSQGVYPSNSDIWFLGKDASDNFSPALLVKQGFDNTPAPKGTAIIEAFYRGNGRSLFMYDTTAETFPPSNHWLDQDYEEGGISVVGTAFGRIFFSGIDSDITNSNDKSLRLSDTVFFSSIVDITDDIGACYQEAAPTAEHISELIDTDGGLIHIPGANKILLLRELGDALMVIADNGIWQISGPDSRFVATEYSVIKISDIGAISTGSIVETDNTLLFWSDRGIYALKQDAVSGNYAVVNVSDNSIRTLYNNINAIAKLSVKGIYDPANKRVFWMYSDTAVDSSSVERFYLTEQLVLDLQLGAFYKYNISNSTTSPYIVDAYVSPSLVDNTNALLVEAGGVQVQAGGVDVQVTLASRSSIPTSLKFVTLEKGTTTYNMTLSEATDSDFKDWASSVYGGGYFSSYLYTGHDIFEDPGVKKVAPYIEFFFNRTETGFDSNLDALNASSCMVQAQWEWSDNIISGRWGAPFQAYRLRRQYIPSGPSDPFTYGQNVIVTKSKLRGKGNSLSLYIYSEDGKDIQLLGWKTTINRTTD